MARKLTAKQRAELKRDPHDLVLTGKGTAAEERKRDPKDLLLAKRKLAKKMAHRHHKKPKLGSGQRFKNLSAELAAKGAKNPGALAAYIGRKKYGNKRFAQLSHHK